MFFVLGSIGSLDNRLSDDMKIGGCLRTANFSYQVESGIFSIQLFRGAGFTGGPGPPHLFFGRNYRECMKQFNDWMGFCLIFIMTCCLI